MVRVEQHDGTLAYVRVELRESFTKSWSLCEQQLEKVAEQHGEGMEAGTPVKEQGMKRPLPEVLPAKAKKTCGAVHDAGKSKKEDLGKGIPSKLGEAGRERRSRGHLWSWRCRRRRRPSRR